MLWEGPRAGVSASEALKGMGDLPRGLKDRRGLAAAGKGSRQPSRRQRSRRGPLCAVRVQVGDDGSSAVLAGVALTCRLYGGSRVRPFRALPDHRAVGGPGAFHRNISSLVRVGVESSFPQPRIPEFSSITFVPRDSDPF